MNKTVWFVIWYFQALYMLMHISDGYSLDFSIIIIISNIIISMRMTNGFLMIGLFSLENLFYFEESNVLFNS